MGNNLNLAIALLANLHRIAEIANAVVDFDLVVQELFKSGDIEDLVRGRLGCVDDVLYCFVKYAHTTWSAKRKGNFFFWLLVASCFVACVCLGGGRGVVILALCGCQTKHHPLGRNYSKRQELM